ncbi:MAG TPA: VanZ family protein [Candidatus Binatia bacterium]|nr:VanZ family protein [Candidatus Binatia bacterium]
MTTSRDSENPSSASRWIPVVAWAGLISLLSTDAFSGDHTRHFLLPAIQFFLPSAAPETVFAIHDLLRKLAHAAEYGVLGWLAVRAYARPRRTAARASALAFALCAAWAALDELHQSFVPSRTPAVLDVALDSAGALAGIALREAYVRWARARAVVARAVLQR